MTTKLLRVGRKLAVLGIATNVDGTVHDAAVWHIVNPGSYNVPTWHPERSGVAADYNAGLSIGRTLCGRFAYTNGYAADWRPPEGQLCSACSERH